MQQGRTHAHRTHAQGTGTVNRAGTANRARNGGHGTQGTASKTPKNQDGANGNDPPPHRKKSVFGAGLVSPNRHIAQTLLVFNSYI